VVQVIPVLALALVIEVRVFVRQMSRRKKKKYLAALSERVTFVVMTFVTVAALVVALAIALPALRSGRSEFGGEFFVVCCLTFAFGFVVLSPVLAMSRALLADVKPRYELWRGDQKIEAANTELARLVVETERGFRSRRLMQRSELAKRYVSCYQALTLVRHDGSRQSQEEGRELIAYLTDLDDWRTRFEESVEREDAILESAREHLRDRPRGWPDIDLALFARAIRELA
jgi:hypothetical protein